MATLLAVAFFLVLIALTGLAICMHVNAGNLVLPISSILSLATVALPILTGIDGWFFVPRRLTNNQALTTHKNQRSHLTRIITPVGTAQFLLVIFTMILLDQHLSTLLSPQSSMTCFLETRWKELWMRHDSAALRAIQDRLKCCGFNSVKDRAWPFPHDKVGEPQQECAMKFGRTEACRPALENALKDDSGMGFGVVLVVAVLQAGTWVLGRMAEDLRRPGGWHRWWLAGAGGDGQMNSGRPSEVVDEDARVHGNLLRGFEEEEAGEDDDTARGSDALRKKLGSNSASKNGRKGGGPRLEPQLLEVDDLVGTQAQGGGN